MKELDRFVYSASHDLRAPLTSLLGLINIAQTDHYINGITEHPRVDEEKRTQTGFVYYRHYQLLAKLKAPPRG